MSISGSLNSALSGLAANARAAEIVSSNIANAATDGYGRREIVLSARQVGDVGQGVTVKGVTRHVDLVLLGDRRSAEATSADHKTRSGFLQRVEQVIGTPEDDGSLSGRIAALDTALIEASSRPESEARLGKVADTARALADMLHTVSEDVQTARARADDTIAASVETLNTTLSRIAEMNRMIRTYAGSGRDASALLDQRQQMVDQLSDIVPVREMARDNGQIALVTPTGAILLDGRPVEFGFTPVGVITPEMTIGSGALSGLTINGKLVATAGDRSPIAGGALAGNFAVRDELAPDAQAKLDAIAREVIDRFSDPALDSSRAPGDPGLFTDGTGAFSGVETGLSQRLKLNAAADPTAGGALWRLRDGLGASVPGAVGNAQLLVDWQSALTEVRTPGSASVLPGQRSLAGLASDIVSGIGSARLSAEGEASFATARAASLKSMELEDGVDTDRELQTLLLIEQNYAANAKVVQTVDEMIKLLLGM